MHCQHVVVMEECRCQASHQVALACLDRELIGVDRPSRRHRDDPVHPLCDHSNRAGRSQPVHFGVGLRQRFISRLDLTLMTGHSAAGQ